MNTKPNIKINFTFKLAYQILSVIIPFVTVPYISRVLGPEGVGSYSFLSSINKYFIILASLGTILYGTREISRTRDNKTQQSSAFWEIELLICITTVISLLFWICLIYLYPSERAYFIAFIPLLLAVIFDISWFYTGIEKIYYSVIWNFISKIIGLIGVFVFVKTKNDLFNYILLMSMSTLIGNMSMWLFLKRELVKINFNTLRIFRHFKPTLKYFVTAIAISIYTVLDKTMIGIFSDGSLENGYYEQVTKVMSIITPFAFGALNEVMIPRMSYLYQKNDIDEICQRISNSIDFELLICIGSVFGIISVAPSFVKLFFGPEFLPAVPLLQLMCPILIPICFSTCSGSHYYVPSGKIFDGTKFTIIGALINIAINIPLIMKYNAIGAVIASLVAESIIAVLYLYGSRQYLKIRTIFSCSCKKIIAAIIMLTILLGLQKFVYLSDLELLLTQVFVGILVYFSILFVLKDNSVISISNFIKSRLVRKNA